MLDVTKILIVLQMIHYIEIILKGQVKEMSVCTK